MRVSENTQKKQDGDFFLSVQTGNRFVDYVFVCMGVCVSVLSIFPGSAMQEDMPVGYLSPRTSQNIILSNP